MKFLKWQEGEWKRHGLAAVAGLSWALAFPHPSVRGLAWLAPGLMLAAALGATSGQAFRVGYVAGFVFYLVSLYWLLLIPVSGFPAQLAPWGGWLVLAAYLALLSALWVWICWKIFPRRAGNSMNKSGITFQQFIEIPFAQRAWWALTCAALWVTGEMIQARLWTGFPWNLLGASHYDLLPIIQISSVTGVYGVSFLIGWFSCSLFCAVAVLIKQPSPRWRWLRELFFPGSVLVAVLIFGVHRLYEPKRATATLKVALVQPNIPQEAIWDSEKSLFRFQQLLALTEKAAAAKPALVVWPEAAVPGLFRLDATIYEPILSIATNHHVWMVIGADDMVWRHGPVKDPASYDSYNSSFLLSPNGDIAGTYRKRRLVIFGEYVPLRRWLPFLKYFTTIGGGFTAGEHPVTFGLGELGVKTSVLICFEDVFPHIARSSAGPDIDFLLNLTNNGWFGESAAQWQHAANAVFRAVENGLPLVRCANNGLSCWVDQSGRLHDVYFRDSKNIYAAGFKIVDLPLNPGVPRRQTVYNRYGDWFGWTCVGGAGLTVLLHLLRTWRVARKPS